MTSPEPIWMDPASVARNRKNLAEADLSGAFPARTTWQARSALLHYRLNLCELILTDLSHPQHEWLLAILDVGPDGVA